MQWSAVLLILVSASKLHRPNHQHSIFSSTRIRMPGLEHYYRRLTHIPCGCGCLMKIANASLMLYARVDVIKQTINLFHPVCLAEMDEAALSVLKSGKIASGSVKSLEKNF